MLPKAQPASVPARWLPRLRHRLDFGWVDREQARADFQLQHDKDRRGDRIHAAVGFLWGVMIVGPISPAEMALALPGVCWLVRLCVVPRAARWILSQPATIAIVAWMVWHIIAWTWSRGGEVAFTQTLTFRFAISVLVLFPIMHLRRVLIAGMVVGFAIGNATQLTNWIGVRHDVPWLVIKPFTDRNGGWWPITYGGEHLVAALGLHLPSAIMGRGKWRIVGIAGSAITIAGLLATGARGPWIAAFALTIIVVVVAIVRVGEPRKRARLALAAVVATSILAAVLWLVSGDQIKARFAQARDEIARAVQHRDFNRADGSRVGDDSARVAMLGWAIDAIREHPILGVGTGGYSQYVKETKQADGAVYDDVVGRGHGHCHNALLHEWATTGLVGMLLALMAAFVAVWSAFTPLTRESLGTYAAGPAFALVGFLMLWPFDGIHANATTAKVLFALVALCPAWYPNSPSEARARG